MSSFEPNERHLRELLIYSFNLKKSAAKVHQLLVETHGEAALSERSWREWFQKFKNGEFDTEDKERNGRPKVYKDAELEALLDQDSCLPLPYACVLRKVADFWYCARDGESL